MNKVLFYNKFIKCLYMFRALCVHIRRSKLYYTASGIITAVGGRPVHIKKYKPRLYHKMWKLCGVVI